LQSQGRREVASNPVHAIIGYWDFPVTVILPILCDKLGLP
jgi:hypothetical protein